MDPTLSNNSNSNNASADHFKILLVGEENSGRKSLAMQLLVYEWAEQLRTFDPIRCKPHAAPSKSATAAATTASSTGQHVVHLAEVERKWLFSRTLAQGVFLFNNNPKPKKGIQFLVDNGIIGDTPDEIAKFLHCAQGLNIAQIGEFIGSAENQSICKAYISRFDYRGLPFETAFRFMLASFRLPKEGQQIDRIVEAFGEAFCEQNRFSTENSSTEESATHPNSETSATKPQPQSGSSSIVTDSPLLNINLHDTTLSSSVTSISQLALLSASPSADSDLSSESFSNSSSMQNMGESRPSLSVSNFELNAVDHPENNNNTASDSVDNNFDQLSTSVSGLSSSAIAAAATANTAPIAVAASISRTAHHDSHSKKFMPGTPPSTGAGFFPKEHPRRGARHASTRNNTTSATTGSRRKGQSTSNTVNRLTKRPAESAESLVRWEPSVAHLLSYALLQLNTFLYNPQVKQKMSKQQFIDILKGAMNGGELPRRYLEELYSHVAAREIKVLADDRSRSFHAVADCLRRQVKLGFRSLLFDIVDDVFPPGENVFSSMRDSFIKQAHGYFLVYSVTDRPSFQAVRRHYTDVMRCRAPDSISSAPASNDSASVSSALSSSLSVAPSLSGDFDIAPPPMVLVATKCDSPLESWQVSSGEGAHLAEELNIPYFETTTIIDFPESDGEVRQHRARLVENVGAAFLSLIHELVSTTEEDELVTDSRCRLQ